MSNNDVALALIRGTTRANERRCDASRADRAFDHGVNRGAGAPDVRQRCVHQRAEGGAAQKSAALSSPAAERSPRQETASCSISSPDLPAIATAACTRCRALVELKLFTAQSDLVSDKVGAIRFFPDGGSNGGRVTLAAGERKFDIDIDWLTGRVAILD